jgi:hypothetical protein
MRASRVGRVVEQYAVEPSDAEADDEADDEAATPDHLVKECGFVQLAVEHEVGVQQLAAGVVAWGGSDSGELSVAFRDGVGPEVISGYVQRDVRVAGEDAHLDAVGGR